MLVEKAMQEQKDMGYTNIDEEDLKSKISV